VNNQRARAIVVGTLILGLLAIILCRAVAPLMVDPPSSKALDFVTTLASGYTAPTTFALANLFVREESFSPNAFQLKSALWIVTTYVGITVVFSVIALMYSLALENASVVINVLQGGVTAALALFSTSKDRPVVSG
jgi:hypothetical protein